MRYTVAVYAEHHPRAGQRARDVERADVWQHQDAHIYRGWWGQILAAATVLARSGNPYSKAVARTLREAIGVE